MKFYKFLSVLSFALILTGCMKPYILPPNTPKAALHVKRHSTFFSDGNLLGIYQDASRCKNLEILGNVTFRMNGGAVDFGANKLVTIKDTYMVPGYKPIDFVFSFHPKANQDYFIVTNYTEVSGFSSKIKATLTLMQEVSSNGKIDYVVTPIKSRKMITGFTSRANGECDDVL